MPNDIERAPYFPTGMPEPEPNADTARFWEGVGERRFLVRHCRSCGLHHHTPKPVCPRCRGFDLDWAESAGRGSVFTYTVIHHAGLPLLADRVPYNAVVVQLDDCDGILVTGNLLEVEPGEIRIGMPVRIAWEQTAGGGWIYRFERDAGP
jgi:hypothetical protein